MEATKKKYKKVKRTKKRGGNTTIFYSTLVLQSSTRTSVCREFSCCTCITMWGSLHYRTWLHIPRMSLLKRALGLHEQASWMRPTSFIGGLSYTYSSMCIRMLHGNPYSSHHIYHLDFSHL